MLYNSPRNDKRSAKTSQTSLTDLSLAIGTAYESRHTFVSSHEKSLIRIRDTIRRNRRDLIHLPDTDERGAPPELDEHTGPDEEAEPNTMSHSDNQPNNSHNQPNDSHDQPTTRTPESSVPPKVRRSGRHSQPANRFDPSWGN